MTNCKAHLKTSLDLTPAGDAQQFDQAHDLEDLIIVRKKTEQLFNENTFLPFFF